MPSQPKIKVHAVRVERLVDVCPDTSFLGEYTDKADDGCIECKTGEYVGDIERRRELLEQLSEEICSLSNCDRPHRLEQLGKRYNRIQQSGETELAPPLSRRYSYFRPYAGGEKWPSKDYKKYGQQDFERMEGLHRGDWCFCGIVAKAQIIVNGTIQTIHSGGLWGVETTDNNYMEQVARDELECLKEQMIALGIGKRAAQYAISQWNGDFTDR